MTDNERAAKRARALTSLLVEKEVVTWEELERAQEEMDEAALSELVTRDSMVGVGLAGTASRSGHSDR